MLTLGPSTRIYLAPAPVDLRRGHDGLCAAVCSTLGEDPYTGYLFVFFGKSLDRIKILYWEQGGFVIHYKRMEKGRFRMPRIEPGATRVVLDNTALTMLLDGIDLRAVSRPTHWEPPKPPTDEKR